MRRIPEPTPVPLPARPSLRRVRTQFAALALIMVALVIVLLWAGGGDTGPNIVPDHYVVEVDNACGPDIGAKLSDDPMSIVVDGRPDIDMAAADDVPAIGEGTTILERTGTGDPQDDQMIVVRFVDPRSEQPFADGTDLDLASATASYPMSDQTFREVDGVMRTTFEIDGPRCLDPGR